MATFPRVFELSQDVTAGVGLRRQVATDGTDIYFWDFGGDATASGVWKYDPALNSETLIIQNSAFGSYTSGSSAFAPMVQTFDKTIFFCASMTNGDLKVWRWNGVSLITDLTDSPSAAVRSITLFADSDTIVAHIGIPGHFQTEGSGIRAYGFWKSNVAVSWVATTFSYIADEIPALPHHLDYFVNNSRDFRALGIVGWTQYNTNLGGPHFTCRFTAGDWAAIAGTEGFIPTFHISGPEKYWHENVLQQTRENGLWSDDLISSTTATPAAFFMQQLNMPRRVRWDNSGGAPWDTEVFEFDGTNMVLLDMDKPAGLSLSHFHSEGTAWAIRTDDGEVYYLFTGSATPNRWGVYHRSAALAATPDSWAKFVLPPPATFYFSEGLPLVGKSFHPFTAVKPGNMDIALDEDTVILGTSTVADTDKIAKSDTAQSRDYANWDGMTAEFTDNDVDGLTVV